MKRKEGAMKRIVFIGDAADTVDLCRFTAINIFNNGRVPLVIDASDSKSLYCSVNGRNVAGITDTGGIFYTDTERGNDNKKQVCDVLLIYCEKARELEVVLDGDNPAFVVLSYGIGRFSYEKACDYADIIGRKRQTCTLVYRKGADDATVDTIKHLAEIKRLFLAPHTEADYNVYEKIDYGSGRLHGLSNPMQSAVTEISLAIL